MTTEAATYHARKRRNAFFENDDGLPTAVKTEDESFTVTHDWADRLNSGETISTSTWTDDGVTSSGGAISGTTVTATVTKTNGRLKNKITTSSSRTLEQWFGFVAPEWAGKVKDY